MSVYTKNGDRGTTDLARTHNVSKSDDRINLAGTIDELISHIGLCRSMISEKDTVRFLEKIQAVLLTIMTGVADPYNNEYKLHDDKTELLEEEIDRLEALYSGTGKLILPGESRLSAQIDITRTVARRAERALAQVSVKFGSDSGSKKYMNRLADYLLVLARYTQAKEAGLVISKETAASVEYPGSQESAAAGADRRGISAGRLAVGPEPEDMSSSAKYPGSQESAAANLSAPAGNGQLPDTEILVQEVLKRMGLPGRITLNLAKKLIDEIEKEAIRKGTRAVIAICTPDGNPVAVHVMDGAFLVSFDVAMKKAYTSVAVRMSTMELSRLAQPGGTLFGLDKMDNGKIVIFGGGVPLYSKDAIIGGLGVSGGTGEEDHELAEYGQQVLKRLLGDNTDIR